MTLKDFYIQLSNTPEVFEKYYSTSDKNLGKIFSFFNTNYRGLLSPKNNKLNGFAHGFYVFQEVEGKDRATWAKTSGAQQEKVKQHVVPMRKSELFMVIDNKYRKTSRGIVFEKMLCSKTLSTFEKLFLCYLTILPGYFSDTPHYIFERTQEVFKNFEESGYSNEEIKTMQKQFLAKHANSTSKVYDLLSEDYLYLDSFCFPYVDINFVRVFKNSSTTEKEELKNFVSQNYKQAHYQNKSNCIVSYKYKPGGNYVKNTIIDTTWILYLSHTLMTAEIHNFDDFINYAINTYNEIFPINKSNLKAFIYDTNKNRSVFEIIYCKLFDVSIPVIDVAKDLTQEEIFAIGPVDATDENGLKTLNIITQSLKKLAKIQSNYKCCFDTCEVCKYFTSKETHKPYLEIHHFIPREFANDFENSIEMVENYAALCPNCHKKIHLAEDTERKHLINILYSERKNVLSEHGLNVTLDQLYAYYKIDK